MRSLRKLARLSWPDRRLLARAGVMLAHAKLALPAVDFRGAARGSRADGDAGVPAATLARAHDVARLVGIAASRVPFDVACLHRSIVLWRLLRREGIPCELQLGARGGLPFEAHAWVECGGHALGEDGSRLAGYRRFDRAVVPAARGRRPTRPAARRTT